MHAFLELQRQDRLNYVLPITRNLSVGIPGREFMFGGVGLAASVAAMEAASGRPAIWATAHYISYAQPGNEAEITVALPAEGNAITQARATIHLGEREVLTAAAALGERTGLDGQWVKLDDVPHWQDCDESSHWSGDDNLGSRIRFRPARGSFGQLPNAETRTNDGRLMIWMRPAEDISIDRIMLAVIADFMTPGIRNATGRHAGGNSLDNTIRYGAIVPTQWVLCDIQIEVIHSGIVHGAMRIFAEDGTLMASASQSMILRVRD
jgi:acyl-CoA thioesterase